MLGFAASHRIFVVVELSDTGEGLGPPVHWNDDCPSVGLRFASYRDLHGVGGQWGQTLTFDI